MRHHTFFLLFVSIGLAACGGSSDVSGGDEDGGSDAIVDDSSTLDGAQDSTSTNDGTNADVVDGTSGDAIADGDATPPVCSSEPTRVACQDCCALEHKEGAKTFETALLACACTDAICKTDCATTACASPPTKADAKCKACLEASVAATGDAGADAASPEGKCNASVTSACSTDARCAAYVTCLGTCP